MPSPKDPIKRIEWLKNLSDSHKGIIPSEETRKRMGISRTGIKNHKWSNKPDVFCKVCGKQLTRVKPSELERGNNQYCSNECKYKDHGQKISGKNHPRYVEKIKCACQKCGIEFEVKPSSYKNGRGKFCSRACASKGLVTKICEVCGTEYQEKPSKAEMRRCCSPTCRHILKSKEISGENNPAWEGGISKGEYCNLWNVNFRKRVRAFFGNICVECGKIIDPPYKNMHVHHVLYDKGICCEGEDVGERLFVTLCVSCHAKSNHNKGYWKEHYTNMINTRFGGKCYYTKDEYNDIILTQNKIKN